MPAEGQLTFNNMVPTVGAALDGLGLAYVPRERVEAHLESGQLWEVISNWPPTLRGYHLSYPSRHHPSPAFSALVEAFGYRSR